MPIEFLLSPHFPGLKLPHANNFEANRLTTYRNWDPNHPVFASKLSKAGFCYTGEGDEVKCCFCSFRHRNWTLGQDPWQVHRQHSPDCHLFTGTINTANVLPNIPLPTQSKNQESHKIAELFQVLQRQSGVFYVGLQETGLEENKDDLVNLPPHIPGVRMRLTRARTRVNKMLAVPRAIDGSVPHTATASAGTMKAMFPQFDTYEKSHTTFYNFPLGQGRLVHLLLIQGFFYTGHGDIVMCHCCGLGLRHWEPGDDPKIAHARWSPRCCHLLNVVSPAFLAAIHREMDNVGTAE